jgi:hypothetical protein
MKKSALKSAMLFASITALAAFAMPAMASAVVWGPVNTNGSLTSTSISANVPSLSTGFSCTGSSLGIHVRTPASSTLDVTSASFTGCTGTGPLSGCAIAMTATGLPWTAVAAATTNVKVNVTNVNATPTGSCLWSGVPFTVSGTLTSGVWAAATHTVAYTSGPGLTFGISGLGSYAMTLTGSYRNPTQTLTLA